MLLVIYIVGEKKTIFLYSLWFGTWDNAIKTEKQKDKWEKSLITMDKGCLYRKGVKSHRSSYI